MDYTLEDAYETLKDAQEERHKELEELIKRISNNNPVAINKTCHFEDVRNKQHKLCQNLLKRVTQEQPKDYPIAKTTDLHVQVLREVEEEVRNSQELLDQLKLNLSDVKKDISYLENKKAGLQKMKEAYVGAAELIANTNYSKEYILTKRLFRNVKKDLHTVVDTIFPDNENFKDYLADLTAAYTKGGDDVYVEVTPEVFNFTNFLVEADIITYHRNDKSKVRLMEML